MSVRDHLTKQSPEMRALYRHVLATVRAIGPVTLDSQGRGIVFQVRARSIGVAFHPEWLELRIWLKGTARHRLLRKVEDFGTLGKGYHFTLRRPTDLDAPLRALLRRAYAVGAQDAMARGSVKRTSAP
jgi:hypothetical protein